MDDAGAFESKFGHQKRLQQDWNLRRPSSMLKELVACCAIAPDRHAVQLIAVARDTVR